MNYQIGPSEQKKKKASGLPRVNSFELLHLKTCTTLTLISADIRVLECFTQQHKRSSWIWFSNHICVFNPIAVQEFGVLAHENCLKCKDIMGAMLSHFCFRPKVSMSLACFLYFGGIHVCTHWIMSNKNNFKHHDELQNLFLWHPTDNEISSLSVSSDNYFIKWMYISIWTKIHTVAY